LTLITIFVASLAQQNLNYVQLEILYKYKNWCSYL